MGYEVLARKWRPAQFDDVVGQAHVTQTLKNAIEANRVAHAYLFVGPRGIGKTTLTRIFAKALNCQKYDAPTTTPCGECNLCREIAAGNSFDVLEIDGASNNGVDQVRDLREQVQFSPASGRFRIFIIDEVHMLTAQAFNALLKTLEEPPPHVKFVFATTEGDKILPTIISRCQRFDLRRINTALIVERLRYICDQEKVNITDDALLAIARGADGGMRDALSALDQLISFKGDTLTEDDVLAVFGLVSREALEALAGHILCGEMGDMLRQVANFDSAGKDLRRLVAELLDHFRNLLVYQHVGETESLDATAEQLQTLAAQAAAADSSRVLRVAELLAESEGRLRHALNVRTLLETALIRCARASTTATVDEVIRRLNAIRTAEPPAATAPAVAPPTSSGMRRQQYFDDPVVKRTMEIFDGDVAGIEE
ncbi:MAG: DNA polymerase III subunit gamma/tau [Lentisphaerae bacterium]|jgi:DNA polymerase-3 subunit gamma/tau|nr:DNA polymerase III subunit gamma/tau [Lentisphaerota bacterium]